MQPTQKISKQQILSDPVEAYTRLHLDIVGPEIDKLKNLWHYHRSLKKLRDDTQLQAKLISRKIGKAKRDGEPYDSLKLSMKEQSAQLKTINENLGNIEQQILALFDSWKAKKPKPEIIQFDSRRPQPTAQVNIQSVTVSLLGHQESEWNTYVINHPEASLYHRVDWRNVIQESYGHEHFYFVARDSQHKVVGILPLTRLSSHLFGDFLVTTPYFMLGGALADHHSVEQLLMQHANRYAASLGIDHIEYRDSTPRNELPVREDKVNMILTLPDTYTELWASFTSKLRAQIKRAKREKPEIYLGGKEHLDDFHRVYARNMRDLGSPPHSKQFILNIMETFPNNCWVIVICLNRRPVAAGMLISHGDTLEIPLASTIREVNPLSINMLMYWEILKFAIQGGFRYFSFGRSTRGSGTYRFKKQWGAQVHQLYWHYGLVKRGELPMLSPANPKYAMLINIWKRMPVKLTKWMGPRIVKNIP